MQRDPLRELAQLVRHAEPDGRNLGFFIAEHATELAHLLQSDESELLAAAHERDGALVDRLRVRLDLALQAERELRSTRALELEAQAAWDLERTARWFELGVALDVDVLLGGLLANPARRTVTFELPQSAVQIPTAVLRRARLLRKTYLDLAAFVDEHGVHFRWKAGKGQINLRGRDERNADALVIPLRPPRQERKPLLLGDVLAEMGFGA